MVSLEQVTNWLIYGALAVVTIWMFLIFAVQMGVMLWGANHEQESVKDEK